MVQTAQNTVEVQQAQNIDRIAGVSYAATPSVNHPDSSETTTSASDADGSEDRRGPTGAVSLGYPHATDLGGADCSGQGDSTRADFGTN